MQFCRKKHKSSNCILLLRFFCRKNAFDEMHIVTNSNLTTAFDNTTFFCIYVVINLIMSNSFGGKECKQYDQHILSLLHSLREVLYIFREII